MASTDLTPLAPTLLFIDDDVDLRETITDAAPYLGVGRCVMAGSLEELEANRVEALASSLAVVDINLGPDVPSGVDVYRWLRRAGFVGRIVFLTGHGADDRRVQEAARLGDVAILSKPIGIDELAGLVATAGGAG
jgi:ActR/RegA family two-component response regulator